MMATKLPSCPQLVAVDTVMVRTIKLVDSPFTPGEVIDQFTTANADAGAIVTMLGKVRAMANGERVKTLHIDHYSDVTEAGIKAAVETAKNRWSLNGVTVMHRIGEIAPGETIVLVATAAVHRREAFEACDYLMDYLKSGAYFWKKEITDKTERWIEPRQQDYDDAARWREKE